MSVSQTMSVAQHLYEQGLITYMRTDSVNLSQQALAQCKEEITKLYGDDLQAVVEREFFGFAALGQAVVLALVGDVGPVTAVLDQHVGLFGEAPQRSVGRGGRSLLGMDDLYGPLVGERVGVVALLQRCERFAVA